MCNLKRKLCLFASHKRKKRLMTYFLVCLLIPIHVMALAQSKVTLKVDNAPVSQVLKKISRKAGISIVFNEGFFGPEDKVTFDVTNETIEKVLQLCLKGTDYDYKIENNFVVIIRKEEQQPPSTSVQKLGVIISGKVSDAKGVPLPFVTIYSKESRTGAITDEEGRYEMYIQVGQTLRFSLIGFRAQEILVSGTSNILNVTLEEEVESLGEVVVTGLIKRDKESFTGATTTMSGEELVQAGTRNVLESISNIDASFRIEENLEFGSDPNRFPNINIRGKSSLPDLTGTFSGNPNQPLFILNGFETTIDRVYDLDMTRVKSITLLKDASAKAIYGAKAGNGVVVIETVEPAEGKLRVNYMASVNIEAPDLTGYNLMNAKEKLAWEDAHDMYKNPVDETQSYRQHIYNQFYQDVYYKGVDTYWLSQPLETGVGQRHSISFEGGDDAIRYSASFFYNDITGAMKGSSRKTYTGNGGLSYRIKKFNFQNIIEFSQNQAANSPYGSFSQYTALNPYYVAYNENGLPAMIAGFYPAGANAGGNQNFYNPLYNAQLNILDQNAYLRVSDNFYAEWNIADGLRFTGTLGYVYQKNDGDFFLPPGHTDFVNYDEQNDLIDYKGKWTRTEGYSKSIQSNIGVNYNVQVGKHHLFTNATLNISDDESQGTTYIGEGFGTGSATSIALANYYQRAGSPAGTDAHNRSIGVVGILNYTFDNQILLDFSYRASGSSIYGANNRWGQFWSVGAGYNIHRISAIQDLNIFQTLKIRGSMGYTGSQNVYSYNSIATYDYRDVTYNGYKGAVLKGLPNPNLDWQKVMDYNVGIDANLLDNKISLRFDIYEKNTDNLLQSVDATPSTGFSSYMANIGKTVNKGIEVAVRYQVFTNAAQNSYVNLSLTGTSIRNRLVKLSDAFASYNSAVDQDASFTDQLQTKPVVRFYEGQSLDAIWAMRSLGIDPATGDEVFMDARGNITYDWSATDLAIVGDLQPQLNGTIGINAGYKGITLSVMGNYKVGGQLYNATLVERVENIDGRSNLDKRIYDAWSKPGDIAIYRKPAISTNSTPSHSLTRPTSRFVQDNDELYLSSINLGYDFMNRAFLRKLALQRLRVTGTMNDVLRISTIETERGTSYPFTRNFSFALNASF